MNWVLQNDRIGIKKRFFFYYSDMPESCGKTIKQESEQTSICDRRDVFLSRDMYKTETFINKFFCLDQFLELLVFCSLIYKL